MELRHLRYFVEAAEAKHFGRAAKRLHIVQSALSMQLRDFEEELGTPLFTRVGKGVVLTNAGSRLLPEARRILHHAGQMKASAQRAARGETGRLRIGYTSLAVASSRLTTDLREFRQRCPEVSLQLQELTPDQQIKSLRQRALDVGYAPDFGLSTEEDYCIDPLCTFPWQIAMPSGHALSSREHIGAADLSHEPFIICGSAGADAAQAPVLGHLLGFEPVVVEAVSDSLAGLCMVAAGLGIAIVPEALSCLAIPFLSFRPFRSLAGQLALVLLSRQGEEGTPAALFRSLSLTH